MCEILHRKESNMRFVCKQEMVVLDDVIEYDWPGKEHRTDKVS